MGCAGNKEVDLTYYFIIKIGIYFVENNETFHSQT